jgi:hypothetical protein
MQVGDVVGELARGELAGVNRMLIILIFDS